MRVAVDIDTVGHTTVLIVMSIKQSQERTTGELHFITEGNFLIYGGIFNLFTHRCVPPEERYIYFVFIEINIYWRIHIRLVSLFIYKY